MLEARDPDQLFSALERVFQRYQRRRGKRFEDVFFLVFALTHLREWIAPGYREEDLPSSAAERFARALSQIPAYTTIRRFANQSKHQGDRGELPIAQRVVYGPIDIEDVEAMLPGKEESPIAHDIGGQDATKLFSQVLAFYREHWFSLPFDTRYGDS